MLTNAEIYNLMTSIENPAITTLTKIISFIFDPITLIIITLAISIYLFSKSKKTQAIFLTATILITAAITGITKKILQVTRPINSIIQETGFASPSGHVTMTVIFLSLITYTLTRNKPKKTKIISTIITVLLIFLVGLSRLYLRVHWLTDTLLGFVLGSIILIISIKLYDKLFLIK